MKRVVLLLGIAITFFACQKENDDNDAVEPTIYGRYTGTFHRTGMDTAEIELSLLSDNRFEGSSSKVTYPAICSGDFTFDGNTLSVNDTCTWAANFDWTLIFDGTYNVSFNGENSLRIWRTNGTFTDEYQLSRFVR